MAKKSFFKRILLIAVFLLGFASEALSWYVTINGINYYVSVTGYGYDAVPTNSSVSMDNKDYSGDLTIPATVTFDYTFALIDDNGNYVKDSDGNIIYITRQLTAPVTQISRNAFEEANVTSAIIGNNVQRVRNSAFYRCTNMTSLSVHKSVEQIDRYAFAGLSSLKHLYWNVSDPLGDYFYRTGDLSTGNIEQATFGPDVNVIPYGFLQNSKVTEIVIPNSVSVIEPRAFSDNHYLINVNLGYSVTDIQSYVFLNCTSLKSISIPNSVTSLGQGAFQGCNSLTQVSLSNSMTTIPGYTFQNCTGLKTIIIPNSITKIEGCAFENCSSLTTMNIPNSVTTIGGNAFLDCSSLRNLTIGKGASSIGETAFNNCTSIKELRWNAKNCSETGMYNSVRENIESVTIGPEVEVLPRNFVTNSKIKQVTIPKSVTTINRGLFSDCAELKKVIWNAENTPTPNIDVQPFIRCNSLTQIIIGKDVKAIGDRIFYIIDSKNNVDSVMCLSSVPPIISINCFYSSNNSNKTYKNATLYVPKESIDAYRTAEGWKEFTTIKTIEFISGDATGDGEVNIDDLAALVDMLLTGDTSSNECADVDGDGEVSIADVTVLIDYLLTGSWQH